MSGFDWAQGNDQTTFRQQAAAVETDIHTLRPTFATEAAEYDRLLEHVRTASNATEGARRVAALLDALQEGGRPKTLRKNIAETFTCDGHTSRGNRGFHSDATNDAAERAAYVNKQPGVDARRTHTWVENKVGDGVLLFPFVGWAVKAAWTYDFSCTHYHHDNCGHCDRRQNIVPAYTATREVGHIVNSLTILKDALNGRIGRDEAIRREAQNRAQDLAAAQARAREDQARSDAAYRKSVARAAQEQSDFAKQRARNAGVNLTV